MLTTGEIESNLPRLIERYPLDVDVSALIRAKVREKSSLSERDLAVHVARIGRLRAELDVAFERSSLPEEPTQGRDLDAFLFRLRRYGA